MKTNKIPFKRQIFVCVNNRDGERASCGDQNGEAVFKELRHIAKERKLHPNIRVAQAKCLGYCQNGVNVMVYPENSWYSGVTIDNVSELANKYIIE